MVSLHLTDNTQINCADAHKQQIDHVCQKATPATPSSCLPTLGNHSRLKILINASLVKHLKSKLSVAKSATVFVMAAIPAYKARIDEMLASCEGHVEVVHKSQLSKEEFETRSRASFGSVRNRN